MHAQQALDHPANENHKPTLALTAASLRPAPFVTANRIAKMAVDWYTCHVLSLLGAQPGLPLLDSHLGGWGCEIPRSARTLEIGTISLRIERWIQQALTQHAHAARSVASFGFRRLPLYYGYPTLLYTKAICVRSVPLPPPLALGLDNFSESDSRELAGLAYLDNYFVRVDCAHMESLHFHELVHVLQWRLLGPGKFLTLYAEGLARFGYRGNPLEAMAYDFQERFEGHPQPFNVALACQELINP